MTEKKVVLDKGVTRVTDERGHTYVDRVPTKKLNPFVKAQLLATLKRDDITIEEKPDWGATHWSVKDSNVALLFTYENAWDYGYYYIEVPSQKTKNNIKVAEMNWYEADNHTNPDQKDIFDIGNALAERKKELEKAKTANQSKKLEEARQNLTAEEVLALQTLGFNEKVRI